ncbi:MAG TPA: tetratricopeptide repeat protein, partial [Gemmatimonadales bacterium]|nr:tetratricopeptide repeat protein [Gemmatimonadales bacterium]
MVTSETLLELAREYDRKGHLGEAAAAYQRAAATAEESGELREAAEALRRLAVVHCKRQDGGAARALCERSEQLSRTARDPDLVAEALNTAGGLELMDERFELARERFLAAASIARSPDLLGRIEQNLATVASGQGDFVEALLRYQNSLTGFEAAGNHDGCAVAYHNLGVASGDLRLWADADRYFRLCLDALRSSGGDLHLRGLASLNHAHALAGLDRLGEARRAAEAAAGIFEELQAPRELADAYVALGKVLRR